MPVSRSPQRTVIAATFIAALVLTIFPLPDWLALIRPEWVAMVLIYWCMALPTRVGVGIAWSVGLFLDVLRAGLLGQHALSLAVIAFFTLQVYQRIRVFPLWQQALAVLVLVALHQMILLWIKGFTGQETDALAAWLPAVGSMLLWPLVFVTLRATRRHFKIT